MTVITWREEAAPKRHLPRVEGITTWTLPTTPAITVSVYAPDDAAAEAMVHLWMALLRGRDVQLAARRGEDAIPSERTSSATVGAQATNHAPATVVRVGEAGAAQPATSEITDVTAGETAPLSTAPEP